LHKQSAKVNQDLQAGRRLATYRGVGGDGVSLRDTGLELCWEECASLPHQERGFDPFLGFVWGSFALKNQFVLSSFFGTFVDSKGLAEFVPSILTSFSHFHAFSRALRPLSSLLAALSSRRLLQRTIIA
jgi:hypothetical protein